MSRDEKSPARGLRDKLIGVKQRWAREGRLLTGKAGRDRLPPGQRLVEGRPVLDLGIQLEIPLEQWRLSVDGLVRAPQVLDWQAFRKLPQIERISDIHCVTSWSRYDNRWSGVAAKTVIELAGPLPEARFAVVHSEDGYTTNLPLAALLDDDVLLAHGWDGAPLEREHGAPVRLVVPKRYFWKSAKWVRRIELLSHDRPGFWEVRGYHNEGDPWEEERYSW